jgi:iron complex outermembrane receptor protein
LLTSPALGDAEESPPIQDETEPGEIVELEEDTPSLPVIVTEEVNITAARSERSVHEVPGNVTVINRETIDRSSARNVPELLRREAGIFVTNTTTNREGYTAEARGFNNGGGNGGRTLVLIDGRRVNEPDGGLPDWAFIPLDNVEAIDVVRGPVNALYGDNAIAGVIQLRTRRPEPGFQGTLRAGSGTYTTDQGSLWLGGGEGPVTASLFVDGHRTNGYRDRSDLRAYRVEGQLLFDLAGRGELRFAGGYDSQSRERPGTLTKEEMEEDRRQATPGSEEDFASPQEHWVQLQLELDVTNQLTFRSNGWHRRRSDDSQTSDPFFVFNLDRDTQANAFDAEFELDVSLWGHRNRTILGGSFLREDIDYESAFEFFPFPPDPTSNRAHRTLWGIFLQNELNLTDDLLLVLGVRNERAHYDGRDRLTGMDFRARGGEWAPKAALSWRVMEPVSVYASYARGFRFPNFDEAFGVYGTTPGLGPESSQSYEVGAKVRTECLTFNLAAYYTNVYDEIFFNPLAPNPLGFFPGINVNLDRVRHRGVEVFASLRPTSWLDVYGSYTFDDVEITRDSLTGLEGSQMPLTPRHRGNAGLRVYLPWNFELGADAVWVGDRRLANDVRNRLDRLPGWARYDLRAGWRRAVTEWLTLSVDATVYNLTGERYTEFGGLSSFSPRVGFFPSPERHYVVTTEVAVNW